MKLVNEEPARRNVTIEFTPYEQDVLAAICSRIGGHPSGPRGVSDILKLLLRNAGAEDHFKIDRKKGSAIYFEDDVSF